MERTKVEMWYSTVSLVINLYFIFIFLHRALNTEIPRRTGLFIHTAYRKFISDPIFKPSKTISSFRPDCIRNEMVGLVKVLFILDNIFLYILQYYKQFIRLKIFITKSGRQLSVIDTSHWWGNNVEIMWSESSKFCMLLLALFL